MAFPTALVSFTRAPSSNSFRDTARIYSISTFDIVVDAQHLKIFPLKRDMSGVVEPYRSESDVNKFRSSPQLNFAVCCATAGCGVGLDLLIPNDRSKNSEEMKFIASLLRFHVCCTTRWCCMS